MSVPACAHMLRKRWKTVHAADMWTGYTPVYLQVSAKLKQKKLKKRNKTTEAPAENGAASAAPGVELHAVEGSPLEPPMLQVDPVQS